MHEELKGGNRGMNSNIVRAASALLMDYACVYYIDPETGNYDFYSTDEKYLGQERQNHGEDFFVSCQKNILDVVYSEDQEMVSEALTKENLLRRAEEENTVLIVYRLLIDDKAVYHRTRIVKENDGEKEHIILGVQNIDNEVKNVETMKEMTQKNLVFSQIAESLARQYSTIYYIDILTDEYIDFSAANEYREFGIHPTGSNFFGVSQRNVGMVVHPDDREKVFDALNKETMLKNMAENGTFTMSYRLIVPEGSAYTRMTVFWASDHQHLIMGILDIEHEMEKELAFQKTLADNATFYQIAESLANQYDTIYFVDMLTDNYIEFASTDVYKSLDVLPCGGNFFEDSLYNIERVIHPEDRTQFQTFFNKAAIISSLQEKHAISHTYRLLIGGGFMYARVSIIWASDNKHVIIGIMNIDQEVRREREIQKKLHLANQKAYRDELTGVKNKAAFSEYEDRLSEQISNGEKQSFSIVVCDVNGLKDVNDRLGHKEGDAYIQNACALICRIWKHSPVFRIGGDEFAVILTGNAYRDRAALLDEICEQVLYNRQEGKVVVAVGMADFDPEKDRSVSDVFERADTCMYENKTMLKQMEEG